jgi:hypothetical protein
MQFQHLPLVKWPRQPTEPRVNALFKSAMPRTLQRLAYELNSITALNPILVTTDHQHEKEIGIDGLPLKELRQPKNPGVILEFYALIEGKGSPRVRMQYACDRYKHWQHNLHSIALTLESLRAVNRYGATAAGEQYAGFKQLPAPAVSANAIVTVDDAAKALAGMPGVASTARMILDSKDIFIRDYRAAANKAHPDRGGTDEQWSRLDDANKLLRIHHRM